MNAGEATNQTITMSERESALYHLGHTLGFAHGLATTASNLHTLADSIRGYQAATLHRSWCQQAAANVRQHLGNKKKGPEAIAKALEEFGDKLVQGQGELADLIDALAVNIEAEAAKKKAEFAAVLPTVGADAAPLKQFEQELNRPGRARGGLGRRIILRIGEELVKEASAPRKT